MQTKETYLWLLLCYSCNKITKFHAKIKMAFSQILAIRGWFDKLQFFLDQTQSGINTKKIKLHFKFTTAAL